MSRRKKKYSEAEALESIVKAQRPLAELVARCQANSNDPTHAAIGRILKDEVWPGFAGMHERGRIEIPKARRLLALIDSLRQELKEKAT